MSTISSLNNAELVTKNTPARVQEAQVRLDTWTMSPKNVRRLTAFVGSSTPAPASTPEPAPVSARAKKAADKRAAKLRAGAKAAFDAAAAAATDGNRVRDGIRARKAFLAGQK